MKKSFLTTEILCLLLGFLGAHRYYTGYIGLGIAQTLTLGGCGLWSLIDLVFISTGNYKDAQGQELEDFNKNIGMGVLLLIAVLVIFNLFAPHRPKTVINNSSTTVINTANDETVNKTTTTKTQNSTSGRKVKFANATCTVSANGYMCSGTLTEADKALIKQIQKAMKK